MATAAAHTRGSILVVDDEPTIGEVVARYLDRAGYETHTAVDGPGAMEAFTRVGPDLIVLDLVLPGIDGLEVMRRVREARERRTARLAADVDAMVERLEGEEEARSALIAAVSHDLRTPITSLRLLADAIDDDLVDAPTRREYAARMSTHVRALSALIDDLFELTRLQSGDLQWTMEQVRVDELVQETVSAMRAAAGTIDVRADVGAPASARANPEKLQRVLFNLIQNAIRHTPPDGTITVRAVALDGTVEFEVADTGSGIPAGDRDRVFEPFYRGDLARTDAGAGLGLAICSAIVEAHGGRIWLADADVGTAVRFAVPVG